MCRAAINRGFTHIYILPNQLKHKLLLLSLTILVSCATKMPEITYEPVPYDIGVPMFPDSLNIPADNPMTVDGVRLGRYLFMTDGSLATQNAQ